RKADSWSLDNITSNYGYPAEVIQKQKFFLEIARREGSIYTGNYDKGSYSFFLISPREKRIFIIENME
ncbi:MAG: hypothetical protein AAGI38_24285, partial [Bacteroidota bacterium]